MYDLTIWDKGYAIEHRLTFSMKLSPKEILKVVNKLGFEVGIEYKDKFEYEHIVSEFSQRISTFAYVDFSEVLFADYMLD